jgi:transcriptional regulator with XRE-family HTH domain
MGGGRVTRKIPAEQCAIAGANIRALRQRNGWTQARLGELMGWPTTATVCAAEGHRSDRQRSFTTGEITRLAAIFGIPPSQLTTRCANCDGHPPAGFACLACGATPGSGRPATSAVPRRARPGHAAVSR